jgi:N-acetylglucosamine kinase
MFGAIIGTGAGGGYCVNGRLLRGSNGVAGEWGHWPLAAALLRPRPAAARLPCGRSGCLERYVSGPGMSSCTATSAAAMKRRCHRARASRLATAQQTLDVHLDLLGHAWPRWCSRWTRTRSCSAAACRRWRTCTSNCRRHEAATCSAACARRRSCRRFGDAGGARGAALLARQP